MVKKLFKHELLAYWRLLLPVECILLAVAAFGRIVRFFESDSTAYAIVNISSIVALAVAVMGAAILTTVFCVIRFHKNLFTGEGYLSFTLPVTPAQHVFVKLAVAILVDLCVLLGIVASLCISMAGDVLHEVVKLLLWLLGQLGEALQGDVWHLWMYALECLVLALVMDVYKYLTFYTCIALGQTRRKNRVGWAVGMYFAYYLITQLLGTVLIAVLSVWADASWLVAITNFVADHPFATVHIGFGVGLVFYTGLSVAWFFLTRYLIHRRLNLE